MVDFSEADPGVGDAGCGGVSWSSNDCNTHPTCLDFEEPVAETVTSDESAPNGTAFQHLDIAHCSPSVDQACRSTARRS